MRIVQIAALWAWAGLWAGARADMCDRRDRRNLRGWKGDVGDLQFVPGGMARDRLQLHHRVRRFLSFPTGSVLTVTPKLTIPWYSELNGYITGSQLYAFPMELNLPNSTLRFATRDRRPENMYGYGSSMGGGSSSSSSSSSTSSSTSSSSSSSSGSDTITRPLFGGLGLNRFDDSVHDHNSIYGSANGGGSAYGYAGAYPHTGSYGSIYAHPYGSGSSAYGQGSAYGGSGSSAYAHGAPYSYGDGSAYAHDGSTYAHGAPYSNSDSSSYAHGAPYSNSDGSTYTHGDPYGSSGGSAHAHGSTGENAGAHDEGSHAVYSRSIDDQRATGFTFLMKVMDNLGFDGRSCLLRAVCEVAEEPIADLGITGEVINLFFSAGFGSGDGQLAEFARAEERGRREGGCERLYPACPHRLMELVTASMSYFHHGLAHVGKAGGAAENFT